MIVATAGHIDHGKTALVKALTGVDTDRLPEEKARGISIDLGFAYWQPPGHDIPVGFIDVPGHERFVRNMLAGVCGIDYAILVVAADDGVMPQTLEHLQILDLLAVTQGVGVITKSDRASSERIAEVKEDLADLLVGTGLARMEIMTVSAHTGIGIALLRERLTQAACSMQRGNTATRARFRLAVDRAFMVAGTGVVVTGTVFDGEVNIADRLVLSPSGREVRVRGIQKHGNAMPGARQGERCALNIADVELGQVQRGDWILSRELHAPTHRLDVRLRLSSSQQEALSHWTPIHLHIGTRDVSARIAVRRGGSVQPGQWAVAQIITEHPVSALHGDRFIFRDQSAWRTLGGGVVIDPLPPPRRNPQLLDAQLAALQSADAQVALIALEACSPSGVDINHFQRSFNLDSLDLLALLDRCEMDVLGKERSVALTRARLATLRSSVRQALAMFHASSPQESGMVVNALRQQYAPALSADVFLACLRRMADDKQIEVSGSHVRLAQHVATDNPIDRNMWQKIQPMLDDAGFNGLTVQKLAFATELKELNLRDFLLRKMQDGSIVRVTPDRFYLSRTLTKLAAHLEELSCTLPGNRFTAAQARDHTGVGRQLLIQLLECLDRIGITRRVGDARVLRNRSNPSPQPTPTISSHV